MLFIAKLWKYDCIQKVYCLFIHTASTPFKSPFFDGNNFRNQNYFSYIAFKVKASAKGILECNV